MKWKLPKQFKDWCRAAGLRPHSGFGSSRKKWAWFSLKGHGRVWRINDKWQLQCGDTYAEFDRWALCDIRSVPLPTTRAEFVAAVKMLLLAHQQPADVVDELGPKTFWVRAWLCRNRNCMSGRNEVLVTHTINLRHHWCAFCGVKARFVRDVSAIEQPAKWHKQDQKQEEKRDSISVATH